MKLQKPRAGTAIISPVSQRTYETVKELMKDPEDLNKEQKLFKCYDRRDLARKIRKFYTQRKFEISFNDFLPQRNDGELLEEKSETAA